MGKFQIDIPLEEFQKEKWVMSEKNGYMKFMAQDTSNISVTSWNHLTIGMHSHAFYEFALVVKGSCVHSYKGVDVPLLSGDVILIAPNERHGYITQLPMEVINCQFYHEKLNDECIQSLEKVNEHKAFIYDKYEQKKRWDEVLQNVSAYAGDTGSSEKSQQTGLDKQGIIHLSGGARKEVEALLQRMLWEQRTKEQGFQNVKSACLQLILVTFLRVQSQRISQVTQYQDEKKEQIYHIIDYIEAHLDQKIDWKELARKSCWSEGYFRSIFKDVTGLAPVEYLNRLRIVKSLEYMEKDHLMVSEAAEKVGIYDPAYYSRLFKKILGYSPRYFKSIKKNS